MSWMRKKTSWKGSQVRSVLVMHMCMCIRVHTRVCVCVFVCVHFLSRIAHPVGCQSDSRARQSPSATVASLGSRRRNCQPQDQSPCELAREGHMSKVQSNVAFWVQYCVRRQVIMFLKSSLSDVCMLPIYLHVPTHLRTTQNRIHVHIHVNSDSIIIHVL